jgi:hypothetical protein
MSSPLSAEERRILELMNALEAQQDAATADAPPAPLDPARRDRFTGTVGFDDHGKPFPLSAPLPSEAEQAEANAAAIKALEELVRRGGGGGSDSSGQR